jgi:hypothetical protein
VVELVETTPGGFEPYREKLLKIVSRTPVENPDFGP